MTTSPTGSLRERSKAKRRAAIQRAALRLFAERGYDGATVADIAEAAEVAPRTVALYFPTKLDIAMSVTDDIAARLTATFETNTDMAFCEVIDLWLAGEADAMDSELAALLSAMYQANPALNGASSAHLTELSQVVETALLKQLGLPATDPMLPVVRAAVTAAISAHYSTAALTRAGPDSRASFITYLNAIINSARTPGG